MSIVYYTVKFKYRKPTLSKSWTTTSSSGYVNQQSETLVMQKLHDQHKDCEIELIQITWK
jgi:hypothetical protein